MTDEAAVHGTSRSRAEIVRYLIGVAVGIVVLLLLFGKRNELRPAWYQLSHANPGWAAAAVGVEVLSMLTFAATQHLVLRLSGARIKPVPLVLLSLANNAIANTVPGEPAISSAYRYRFYRRQGTSSESAGWTIFTILVAQAIGMSLILLFGVLIALASGGTKDAGITIAGLVIVVAAIAVLVRRDLILRFAEGLTRLAHRFARRGSATDGRADRLAERIQATLSRMREIPLSTGSAVSVAAIATAVWFGDFLCLVCGFEAIHAAVPWNGVLLAYGAAQVAGTLPIVPGGLGIIEGSLAIILVGYGASRPSALAAAVIYRAISFWLAIAAGWISVGVIARRYRRT
jgi:uncharacterized protein (TIRG00374 family)